MQFVFMCIVYAHILLLFLHCDMRFFSVKRANVLSNRLLQCKHKQIEQNIEFVLFVKMHRAE